MKNKCIFLDRDGVINRDLAGYAYRLEDFEILPGVAEALWQLKQAGYLLVVVTNQSGIAQGIYTREQMQLCHDYMQEQMGDVMDAIYYAPHHPSVTESLTRKPDSLMFEKAIAKFDIDVRRSWMIGDKERDMIPAVKLGIASILIDTGTPQTKALHIVKDLPEAVRKILKPD